MPSNSAVLRVDGISKEFGGNRAVDDVSFELGEGVVTMLLGPSGAGKSVLMRIAEGLEVPDQGSVTMFGVDPYRLRQRDVVALRRQTGVLMQSPALWQNMTVEQNVALPLEVQEPRSMPAAEQRDIVLTTLERLGYTEPVDRRPSEISLGARRIVAIARAMVNSPRLLFLDEPTSSLDSATMERLRTGLREAKRRGVSMLVVSHDAQFTSQLADRIIVMHKGHIIAHDTTERVVASQDKLVQTILTDVLSQAATYAGDILDILGGTNLESLI